MAGIFDAADGRSACAYELGQFALSKAGLCPKVVDLPSFFCVFLNSLGVVAEISLAFTGQVDFARRNLLLLKPPQTRPAFLLGSNRKLIQPPKQRNRASFLIVEDLRSR